MQSTLVPEPMVERPREAAAGRLLAVRKARAAFSGGFVLRSAAFRSLLAERAALLREREGEREALLDELHRAVPREEDPARRRALIHARRDVFNRRPVARSGALPGALGERARRHDGWEEAESRLLERWRGAVRDEVAAWVAELLRHDAFVLACRHSSPGLVEALERGTPGGAGGDFPGLFRGLHAYATRFASKPNPFHVFAEVLLPPGSGPRPRGAHEVVADVAALLELERRLLPLARRAGRSWIALSPFTREGEATRFWVTAPHGFDLVALREGDLLRLVRGFFGERRRRTGRPTGRWRDWDRYAAARLPAGRHEQARDFLERLVARGIVTEYAVTTPAAVGGALAGLSPEHEELVSALSRHHLSWTDTAGVRRAEEEVARAARFVPEPLAVRCYVNSYGTSDTARHEAAAEEAAPALARLKPLFLVRNNFTGHEHVISAFLRDHLAERGDAEAPYLEVLRHFLRHREEIVARYRWESHLPPDQRRRLAEWEAEAAAHEGELRPDELARLAAGAPRAGGWRGTLCFNGPFDYAGRVLYLSNVFAGGGRFAGRYLLRRRLAPPPPVPGEEDGEGAADVELAVPLDGNLNYVVPAFTTGCGFEARLAHRYRRWIGPAEIVVEAGEDGVRYRHARSGRRLRFHHRGFLLAQQLPAEYQLLLAGHGDSFANPFLGAEDAAEPGAVSHTRELRHGGVCVRRERWSLQAGLLKPLARDGDALRFAARLRDWVHGRILPGEELWFYRVHGGQTDSHKPRFLDLRDPLGAVELRRALRSVPDSVALSFSPMRPPPGGLLREGGDTFATELMIEV